MNIFEQIRKVTALSNLYNFHILYKNVLSSVYLFRAVIMLVLTK